MKFLVLLGLVAIGTNALRVAEQKHDGNYRDYRFDESKRGSKCSNDDQCDRDRQCSQGNCREWDDSSDGC